jgi:hypothetical protein
VGVGSVDATEEVIDGMATSLKNISVKIKYAPVIHSLLFSYQQIIFTTRMFTVKASRARNGSSYSS